MKSAISKIRFQEGDPSKCVVLPIKVKTNHWSIFRQATFLLNKGKPYWRNALDDYRILNVILDNVMKLCALKTLNNSINYNNVGWNTGFNKIEYLFKRHVTDSNL